MKALGFYPGKGPEIVEVGSFEEQLGGAIETLWPFKDLDVCLVVLCDREEMESNRILYGRTIRGPFFVARCNEDFLDIREEDIAAVEGLFSFAEPDTWARNPPDPFEEDVQEEEAIGHIQIVDEETFYRKIKEEIE